MAHRDLLFPQSPFSPHPKVSALGFPSCWSDRCGNKRIFWQKAEAQLLAQFSAYTVPPVCGKIQSSNFVPTL